MKATKASIGRALDQPDSAIRLYLFHGPDEGQSRGLAARLLEGLQAEKFSMNGAAVRAEPASLVDEASAMSLFGGRRAIWIEPAGKDIEEAVKALLDAAQVENPVIAISGALPRTSPLLKLAESSPAALAFAAYAPEGQDAARMVADIGRRYGLKIGSAVGARLADSCGSDQAVVGQELQKLALYIGADPHSPKELDHDAIDAIGAESARNDFLRLADLALGGEVVALTEELARLPLGGGEAVPVIRSLQRRLTMLAPARARVEQGERPDAVMASLGKAVFWKEKAAVERMLTRWRADDLARIAERAGKLERELMFSSAPAREALGEELLAIARKGRSRA